MLKSPNDQTITMYFTGRETLFFTNNGMSDQHGIFTQLFLDPEIIFSLHKLHIMFINASTKSLLLNIY